MRIGFQWRTTRSRTGITLSVAFVISNNGRVIINNWRPQQRIYWFNNHTIRERVDQIIYWPNFYNLRPTIHWREMTSANEFDLDGNNCILGIARLQAHYVQTIASKPTRVACSIRGIRASRAQAPRIRPKHSRLWWTQQFIAT